MAPSSILRRVAAGDSRAVEECLAAYRGLVWSIVRRGLPNLADAEDAVQEIFIDVWRNAGRYDPQVSSESTFITTIARRRLIDRYRRRSRGLKTTALTGEADVAAIPHEQRLDVDEEVERVLRCMRQLRPEEQQVLDLSLRQGIPHQEIARTTNLPLGTVKTHARRGLAQLRSLLGGSMDSLSAGVNPAASDPRT